MPKQTKTTETLYDLDSPDNKREGEPTVPIQEHAQAQEDTYHVIAVELRKRLDKHLAATNKTVGLLKGEVARLADRLDRQDKTIDEVRDSWRRAQNERASVQRDLDNGLLTNGQLYRKCLKELEDMREKLKNVITPEKAVAPLRGEMQRMSRVLDANKRDADLYLIGLEKRLSDKVVGYRTPK